MLSVAVVGANLAGLSAATRLADLGYNVTLYEKTERLGGAWAHPTGWLNPICLPHIWYKLFERTGTDLNTVLSSQNLELVPQESIHHIFPESAPLDFHCLADMQDIQVQDIFGSDVARAWGRICRRADKIWPKLRRYGWDDDEALGRREMISLQSRTCFGTPMSMAMLSKQLPDTLGAILLTLIAPDDPALTPSWVSVRLAWQRRYGYWILQDTTNNYVVPLSRLTELLIQRVKECGVRIQTSATIKQTKSNTLIFKDGKIRRFSAVLNATTPWSGAGLHTYGLLPAIYPTVTTIAAKEYLPRTFDHTTGTSRWSYFHEGKWFHAQAQMRRKIEHHSFGARWDGEKSLRHRLKVTGTNGVFSASTANRAGGDPEAQLSTAALAAAAIHQHLQASK